MNSKRHARLRKIQQARSYRRWCLRVMDFTPCECWACKPQPNITAARGLERV